MRAFRVIQPLVPAMVVLALSTISCADIINVTFTQATLSGAVGTTVTFDATLTNTSTGTVFLNGDSFTTSSPFLTADDNPFLTNAPLSLTAGASSGPFPILSVFIASGATVGSSGPNSFTILGGSTSSDLNWAGSAVFTVEVLPAPEPSTLVLFASGMAALSMRNRFRKT